MEQNHEKEQETTQVLEVENEVLETIIRSDIADDNNNKAKKYELKGSSDRKENQADKFNIIIASAEAFAKILLKDQMNKIEKVKEKLKC